jgi:hypothetical protein
MITNTNNYRSNRVSIPGTISNSALPFTRKKVETTGKIAPTAHMSVKVQIMQ